MPDLRPHPHPAGLLRRGDDDLRLAVASLVQSHETLLTQMTSMEAVRQAVDNLVKVPRQRVLWSGTAVLDANGVWSKNFHTGSRALAIVNWSTNGQIVVSTGPQQANAPGSGAGVHLVPAGVSLVFNNDTTDWTLYGTAAQSVDIQIFSVPIQPMAAGNI